jgi:RNA polymerase sigma factor (sigma-70 family)
MSEMKFSDVDLPPPVLARARAGEPAALEAFYRSACRPAHALARRIVHGAQADDVVQEAFLDAFRGLPGYDARAPLGLWFRQIVVRRCLMHLRSPWHRGREWLDGWLESADAGREPTVATAMDLERALADLPSTTRAVVWLYDVEGYTHEEIAQAMGRTVSFSKSQLARGHARLRARLVDAGEPAAAEVTGPCTRANTN